MSSTLLSNHDLGVFFDATHDALAPSLASAAALLATDHDAAHVARRMGTELGLYDLLAKEPHLDIRSLCLAREALGYHAPTADSIFAVQGLGTHPLRLAGSAEQRALLPNAYAGELVFAFALTEPNAGSDIGALATTARLDSDHYVLNGTKTLISNAGIATHYCVFANTDPALGKRGISAFLVPAATPGLHVNPIAMSVDHPIGALAFDGCRVPKSALIGELGHGLRLALATLDTFRVSVGAAAVGMARRALDESLARVRTRQQFGAALATLPLIQTQLAAMATELDAARLLVLRAAHAKDVGEVNTRNGKHVAMAKLFATEAAHRIIDRAVQLHGGLGVQLGSVVERLYREIRPLRIYEGTSEIQHLIIGRALVEESGS